MTDETPAEPVAPAEKPAEPVAPAEAPAEPEGETPAASPVDEAKKILKNITEQNVILQQNLKKMEKLQAETILGGVTPAGRETKIPTDEDKDIEAARKLLKGTGFEDELFPKS